MVLVEVGVGVTHSSTHPLRNTLGASVGRYWSEEHSLENPGLDVIFRYFLILKFYNCVTWY